MSTEVESYSIWRLIKSTLRRPWAVRTHWTNFRRFIWSEIYYGARSPIREVARQGLYQRQYESYEQYITHQRSKFKVMKSLLNQAFERRRENFVEQFKTDLGQHPGHAVLCLGARDGAEVAAMRSLGLLAIGIDLEYPDDNAFVHKGDFHNIPYPPDCFDYVYTNCFDHLFDVEKLMAEVQRIVRPATGRFVLDLPTDGALGGYESFGWQDKSDIETVLESIGWVVDDRRLRPDEAFWRYILVPPVEQAIKADVSS